jgi:hypothetical protein
MSLSGTPKAGKRDLRLVRVGMPATSRDRTLPTRRCGSPADHTGACIGAGSYLLRNVKVKAQIEKPLRKEIVE